MIWVKLELMGMRCHAWEMRNPHTSSSFISFSTLRKLFILISLLSSTSSSSSRSKNLLGSWDPLKTTSSSSNNLSLNSLSLHKTPLPMAPLSSARGKTHIKGVHLGATPLARTGGKPSINPPLLVGGGFHEKGVKKGKGWVRVCG